MATTYPLSFLSDHLRAGEITLSIVRNDELSGAGTGQFWAAELAPPLWSFSFPLAARRVEAARAIDARVWSLGVNRPFLFADPSYSGPAAGAPGAAATVTAISADRTRIALAGLPPGFTLTFGDRLSIVLANGRIYFGTFAGEITAGSDGASGLVEVFPAVPMALAIGAAVTLAQPVCRVIIPPDGYTAFTALPGQVSHGATLQLLQKV